MEITLVSFRLGLFAHHAASHLESDDSREIGRNWSFKVSGLAENDVQNALNDFNSATVLCIHFPREDLADRIVQSTPRSNQAYLGVTSNDCMTICGPPTVLERLLCSSESLRVNQHNLPIYSPFHAPHLHSDVQSRSFLYSGIGPPEGFWNSYELVLPLIPTTEGQLFNTSLKSEDLLGQIIEQILIKQMSLGNMIDGCVTQLASHQCEECRLVICGRSSLQAPFLTAVQLQGGVNMGILDLQKLSRPHTMDQSTRTSRKPKLAIVGMAGRFPDAADHESFWSLLEQGLDLHRKVMRHSLHRPRLYANISMGNRCRKIDLTLRNTMIRQERSEIRAIRLMGALSMSLASLIHASSICLHARLRRRIRCIALVSQARMKLWKWQDMFQIGRPPRDWIELEPSMVRRATTGEKSMLLRMLTPISSRVASGLLRR